jgi:hypothetical protein
MASILAEWFGFRTKTVDLVGSGAEKLKTVAEFLGDATEKVSDQLDKDHGGLITSALEVAAPWADMVGDVLPPVKLLAKILQKATTINEPEVLGLLACNAAYQRAIEEAVKELPEKTARETASSPAELKSQARQLKKQFADSEVSTELSFRWFSLEQPLAHPFAVNSRRALEYYARLLYSDEVQIRQLVSMVEGKFPTVLKLILSDRELAPKFAPFKSLVELGTGEERLTKALERHSNYQRWLFDSAEVLGKEPFPLKSIYVAPDCGQLEWSAVRDVTKATKLEDRIDPFLEKCGGRNALLERVLAAIADPKLVHPIIVQGAAGSGKSSFTLHLCSVLRDQGLNPIRVRFRDLPLKDEFYEALGQAIVKNSGETGGTEGANFSAGEINFKPAVLDGSVEFQGTRICPYVLIFDGWDEISVSATYGFKARVENIISDIVSKLVGRAGSAPVRVVVTGRPSIEVNETRALKGGTPVLTMRPFTPEQLKDFAERVANARAVAGQDVSALTAATISELETEYRTQYEVALAAARPGSASLSGSFAVFGLPLLAHLSLRLIWLEKTPVRTLAQNPTALYRKLVDLTAAAAASGENVEQDSLARLYGGPLRDLLRKTAVAMTIRGTESVSYAELESRLNLDGGPDSNGEGGLDSLVRESTVDSKLSELMISYYFKAGNRELGCEFLHKSFREYLFAEAIVETVKQYGREKDDGPALRTTYWKDFESPNPRYQFSRDLANLLASQWLTAEVCGHVEQLLEWEIERSARAGPQATEKAPAGAPEKLELKEWSRVRDLLAELWEWWSEGVPVRPQPRNKSGKAERSWEEPLTVELVQMVVPRDIPQKQLPVPIRTTTVDSHLGDGIFRLTALVHYRVAVETGWLEVTPEPGRSKGSQIWEGVTGPGVKPRKYQVVVQRGAASWVLFAPSGDDPRFIGFAANRINAAGWRPHGCFPLGADLRGCYLKGCELVAPGSNYAAERATKWDHANLQGFAASQSDFRNASMIEVFAPDAELNACMISDANFSGADLTRFNAMLSGIYAVNFSGALLNETDLTCAAIREVDFTTAEVTQLGLRASSMERVNVKGIDPGRVDLKYSKSVSSGVEEEAKAGK